MQFQVPQFIDVAPKIIGPLTLKQFLYIAAAALPAFLLFFVLEFLLWILVAGLLLGAAVAISFGKVNGQPLERIIFYAFNYFWNPRLYLWRRAEEKQKLPELRGPKSGRPTSFGDIAEALKKPFFSRSSSLKGAPEETEEKTPLSSLSLKLTTTARPIEKREKTSRLFGIFGNQKELFEEFRKTTGEREEARRIDYR